MKKLQNVTFTIQNWSEETTAQAKKALKDVTTLIKAKNEMELEDVKNALESGLALFGVETRKRANKRELKSFNILIKDVKRLNEMRLVQDVKHINILLNVLYTADK